ncbi:MAG TPA: hypothetical protein VFM46_05495, partial [Pseudomonadales bacterium]|nr:hypothetical protein [Pseudomonadales bacterium]
PLMFSRPQSTAPRERSIALLCLSWIISILAFFSLPASKLVGYALPVIAPMAIWIMLTAPQALQKTGWRWLFTLFTLVLAGVFVALALKPPKDTAQYLRWGAALVAGFWLIAALLTRSEKAWFGQAAAWLATGFLATLWTGHVTLQENTSGIQASLRCHLKPGDQIIMRDEYLYDLPFYLNLQQPVSVYDDWEKIAQDNNDNWAHELLDAGKFDAAMNEKVLRPLAALNQIDPRREDIWLVIDPYSANKEDIKTRFRLVADHGRWLLMRPISAPDLSACP